MLAAQCAAIAPVAAALERRRDRADEFGRIPLNWRIAKIRAALQFLDDVSGRS